MLIGRAAEQVVIGRILASARAGRSGALVIRGEAGIGKTVRLDDAAGQAEGMRVLRTTGVPGEAELPFAGLHLLLRPVTDRIQHLPDPQAAALRAAFGLAPAPGIDPFAAGVALLMLLSDLAEDAPLLVLVDDAQWLDQASVRVLVFAARRLDAEGVAVLFAARTGEEEREEVLAGSGLPELEIGRLDDEAAETLLTADDGELVAGVRARIIAEADGNPLALLELPKGLSAQQRRGSLAALPVSVAATPAPSRVQESFARRIARLPAATRVLLLVAAAEEAGELTLVLEAAGRLGAGLADAKAAERAGLVDLTGARLAFRHPLVRAAAYQRVPVAERMAAHRALEAALTGAEHADRRAWHLAAATVEPDEAVAAGLVAAARRARDRGAIAAAAAALERAAQLSPDPRAKSARLAGAAQAALEAGQPDRAGTLADLAASAGGDQPDQEVRAGLATIRADVALQYRRSPTAAASTLLEAAGPAAAVAPAAAVRLLAAAASVAWFGGDRATAQRASAALEALPPSAQDHAGTLVAAARGMRRLLDDDFAGALPVLQELVAHGEEAVEGLPVMWLNHPTLVALWTGDEQAGLALASAQVEACRARGVVGGLPIALLYQAMAQLLTGRHRDAHASATEMQRLSQDTGQVLELGLRSAILARLAAIEGDQERCEALAKDVYAASVDRSLTPPLAFSASALTLLDLGLGRYEAALERLDVVPRGSLGDLIMLAFSVSDLVEAAVRAGQPERARVLLGRYQAWATHTGQAWAQAVAHRCQALLHAGEDAQRHYTAALRLHAGSHRPFEHARTRLAYGQWLRRDRQRTAARGQLHSACETFERLGATPWAQQARTELRAAGETTLPTAAHPDLLERLTPQELQVVRLAATGASNRDIAAQLFLSPRTVGYHLYKAFPKLGVASRHELNLLDLDQPGALPGATR